MEQVQVRRRRTEGDRKAGERGEEGGRGGRGEGRGEGEMEREGEGGDERIRSYKRKP